MAWSLVFSENWTGTNGDPWPSARWTDLREDSSSVADIQGNRGRMVAQGGTLQQVWHRSVPTDIGHGYLTFQIEWASSGTQYTSVQFQSVGAVSSRDGYELEFNREGGSNTLRLRRTDEGSSTVLAQVGFTPSTSTVYNVELAYPGDESAGFIGVKVWQDGTSKPSGWTVSTTDSTYTHDGYIRFRHINSWDSSAAREIFIDNLEVYEEGVAAVTADIDHGLSWTYSNKLEATLGAEPVPDAITADIDHGLSRTYSNKLDATLGSLPAVTVDIAHGVTRTYSHKLNVTLDAIPAITADIDHGVTRAYGHAMNVTLGSLPAITGDINHGVTRTYSNKLDATIGTPPANTVDIAHGVTWTYSHKLMTLDVEVLPFGVRPGPSATLDVQSGPRASPQVQGGPSATLDVQSGPRVRD